MKRNWWKALFAGSVAILVPLLVEGSASIWLDYRAATHQEFIREQAFCEYDAELGWRPKPNRKLANLYGKGIGYSTNSQRVRATREYTSEIPPGKYRILCLGDSFTMGFGVGNDET